LNQEKVREIEFTAEKRIKEKELIIFQGDASFDVVLDGIVASNLCKQYEKPVFLYKKMKEESQGTVRAPKETDAVQLMKNCSELLLTFGGHPQAAGFRIKNENLEKFKKCLIKNLYE